MKTTIKILTLILFIGLSSCAFKNDRKEYAEMIIEKVVKFEIQNNRLPKNISEIGLTEQEDSKAFYQLTSDTIFMVWYGLSVGESKVYKSSTKEWTKGG
jgi:hypothetical protein